MYFIFWIASVVVTLVVAQDTNVYMMRKPLLGDPVSNGSKPLFEFVHKGTDAIFALACNYPVLYYRRFVGSLRKVGYTEDVVLAVSPPEKMKPGVLEYLKEMQVLACKTS